MPDDAASAPNADNGHAVHSAPRAHLPTAVEVAQAWQVLKAQSAAERALGVHKRPPRTRAWSVARHLRAQLADADGAAARSVAAALLSSATDPTSRHHARAAELVLERADGRVPVAVERRSRAQLRVELLGSHARPRTIDAAPQGGPVSPAQGPPDAPLQLNESHSPSPLPPLPPSTPSAVPVSPVASHDNPVIPPTAGEVMARLERLEERMDRLLDVLLREPQVDLPEQGQDSGVVEPTGG